jgi:DNA-binding response OmpR family regulator
MRLVLAGRREDRPQPALEAALRGDGFVVRRVRADDVPAMAAFNPHAVLVDLGLMDQESMALCERIRRKLGGVALVALTARADRALWIEGRRVGIDDYVVRPYGLAELTTRIRAAVKAPPERRPDPASLGPVVVDPDERRVNVHGVPVVLTRKEFDLLLLLASMPGSVLGRELILRRVWHTSAKSANRTLEVHIATLRAKLGVPDLIRTVRGIGYVADAELPKRVSV